MTENARLTRFNGFLVELRIVRTDLTGHGGNFHIRHPFRRAINDVHVIGSSPSLLSLDPEAMVLSTPRPPVG